MKIARFLLALGVVGCASFHPRYDYSRTTSAAAPQKPSTCDFDVLTARPNRPFDEIGVLDGVNGVRNAGRFRDVTRAQVCGAGGDAVLAEVNGNGFYVRGTVIRYRER